MKNKPNQLCDDFTQKLNISIANLTTVVAGFFCKTIKNYAIYYESIFMNALFATSTDINNTDLTIGRI